MAITDLSSFTSKNGIATSVWKYEEADTFVVQHDFVHMSFFKEEFKDFVETLITALRTIERCEGEVMHLHPTVFGKNKIDEMNINTSEN
ncbi:MAG: hypothetical protein JW738_03965 [Actinobacteria bacterium]|nr:hypothetical protein [Actinomycetota bacterium]